MTKNKLVLHSIPYSSLTSYDTNQKKIKYLMEQIKTYLDGEGFITGEIIESSANAITSMEISVTGYTTKFAISFTWASSNAKFNFYIIRNGGIETTKTICSFTVSDTSYYVIINYFFNDFCVGLEIASNKESDIYGIGSDALFIFKSDTNEYYQYYDSGIYIYDSNTGRKIDINYPSNKENINKAIISKIPVSNSYLSGVYMLSLSSRSSSYNVDHYEGGIIINLKGYGNFFCITYGSTSSSTRRLLAIQMDDEETTETVTTTPTNESQTT